MKRDGLGLPAKDGYGSEVVLSGLSVTCGGAPELRELVEAAFDKTALRMLMKVVWMLCCRHGELP